MGAPLAPVPSVLKVELKGVVDGQATPQGWANVLHFQYAGSAPGNVACDNIAAAIQNAWSTRMAAVCPAPTKLTEVVVTDLTSNTAGSGSSLGSTPGTRGDDSIPANAALLISYPSALRYKGGHPRQYLYVLGNADLTGATDWTLAAKNEVQIAWRAFLTDCTAISSGGTALNQFVSVRYKGKFLPNSGPPHFYLTTPLINPISPFQAIAQQKMASQRGRIGRRSK